MAASLDTGVLYCDDNLARLSHMPSESVDLVYLDPPFFSSRVYEVIWGDEAEVRSFEDRWAGGIQNYIGWMRERVEELHRVLRPTGSLYLHCDPHASHYLKVMLDSVFRAGNFRSEIIWKRSSAHNSARRFGPVHDVILLYSKGARYTWNSLYQDYDENYMASKYRYIDEETGRRYRLSDLTGPGKRDGESGQPWRGVDPTSYGRHWAVPGYAEAKYADMTGEVLADLPLIERLERLDSIGLVQWPAKAGGRPELRRFLDEMPGVPLQDVWTDIDPVNSRARERLGYPTQKPEALMERILLASSNPGDVVLDPFCGCGTTIAVAGRLDRQWIGIDISPTAIEVIRRRLWRRNPELKYRVEGLPDTVAALKMLKPFEFQNWVIQQMAGQHSPRKTHDMGIDGYAFLTRDPIQVKQSEKVDRVVVDNFQTALRRAGADSGYIVAFSFTSGAKEEAARARWDERLHIRLITVSQLLNPPKGSPIADLLRWAREEGTLLTFKDPKDKPSAVDLILSDKGAASAR